MKSLLGQDQWYSEVVTYTTGINDNFLRELTVKRSGKCRSCKSPKLDLKKSCENCGDVG